MRTFQTEIDSSLDSIRRMTENIQQMRKADALLQGVDLSECSAIYARSSFEAELFITLYLSEDHRDSKLAHVLARKLHAKFEKRKSWQEDSLNYHANGKTEGIGSWHIEIVGAVPATCQLITTEVPLTEAELEAAREEALARVKTVRVKTEIRCGKPAQVA